MRLTVLLAVLLIFLNVSGCQKAPTESEVSGAAQGTTYHIKMVLDGMPVKLEQVQQQVTTTLDEIDAQMSNYRDDSEISHLNQQENSNWLPASPEIIQLLTVSQTVYERSKGCYDLTVKPLFDLWGFSRHENRIPSAAEIQAILPHIGMSLLEVDVANQHIRKKDPKLKIDLSGIAQGYSVGVVAHRLEALGINNYMVEIGGEMMVKGRKANGGHWRIAVQTPTPLTHDVQKIIEVRQEQGTAIMTAGTYQNFFEENGKTYSHIINPKTGSPVTHHLRSVTIMHDDPVWADAWDTALLCVGEEEATRIVEAEQLRALLIYDRDNKLVEQMSKAFVAMQ